MSKTVIFGATSAIAMETAKLFAAEGEELFLVGRDREKLDAVKRDLLTRGAARIETAVADLSGCDGHAALLSEIAAAMPDYDAVLVAYGSLGDQKACEEKFEEAEKEFRTNFLSVVSLLTPIANRFEGAGRGTIAVISSVAGDRGRRSNYVYGAAKGGLSIYLQGLRNRLHFSNVTVLTVKPGFVDTPMTAGVEKGRLFVGPDVVARGIHKAMRKRRDVVYLPGFWRWIMAVITHVPESLFKRQQKI